MKKVCLLVGMMLGLFMLAIMVAHRPNNSVQAKEPNACVQLCQARNRDEVSWCNYPEKEPKALKECLATARRNFDACMQACR